MRSHKRPRRKTLTTLPANNRQLLRIRSPVQDILSLPQLLQLHCQLTLANFILREYLQVTSETELLHPPNEPLGRVILVPLDSVTVVHGELMVEIVVTFTNGNESGDHMVTRSVLVVEGSLAKPVSKRVDTEGRLEKEVATIRIRLEESKTLNLRLTW